MSNNIMTANILMKDVLKPSGWECPEALLDKTFAECVSGDGKVEDNKAVTLTANGETEITPSSGKTSMKKVTATVAVPIEENKAGSIDVSAYTEPVEITPTSGKAGMAKCTVTLTNIPVPITKLCAWVNDTVTVFTTTAQPTTSTKALVGSATGISQSAISAVAEEYASITVSDTVYTRTAGSDITL